MDHVKGPRVKYICRKGSRNPTTGLAGDAGMNLLPALTPAGPECKDDFARKFELILLLLPRTQPEKEWERGERLSFGIQKVCLYPIL